VVEAAPAIETARREVARLAPGLQRARLPLEIYPVSAGIKGGLAGSIAMAVPRDDLRPLQRDEHLVPINLLAAASSRTPAYDDHE